jgi:DNA topoisomerase-1
MKTIHHNGVLVPPHYKGKGLTVILRGKKTKLNDKQEERAIAWAKKIGTPYVEDRVFAENFHKDFSKILGEKVQPGDVDYSKIHEMIIEERETRKKLSREERKRLTAERKDVREANKEKFGWAEIDGRKCEIGNYTAEPSSIFMGRGEHPLRGRWKEGPRHEDIELNLSPDAQIPPGKWKKIIWDPESIWIARWRDKLSDKIKYVWPHESSPIQQQKDIEKFNKAIELRNKLEEIRNFINKNLVDEDTRRRKNATVCYLIDNLNFRVGDEKDEDEEADTVGASSLRPEHLCFNQDGTLTFDYLGKDSVRHIITAKLEEQVTKNLREFSKENKDSTLFDEVNSNTVSSFLDEAMEGLSAKVFRTCHATTKVENELKKLSVKEFEPDYKKKHVATLANLEAAIICNHKRTIPKTWEQTIQKQKERLNARKIKAKENIQKYRQRIKKTDTKYKERLSRYNLKLEQDRLKLDEYKKELKQREKESKSTKGIKKRISSKRKVIRNTRERIQKTKSKHRERLIKLTELMEIRRKKDKEMIEKYTLQIKTKELTRDYNLGTSLKSYVDPRVYFDWGRKVDYDWRNYYSKTLEKKFSWVEPELQEQEKNKQEPN